MSWRINYLNCPNNVVPQVLKFVIKLNFDYITKMYNQDYLYYYQYLNAVLNSLSLFKITTVEEM